MHQPCKQRMCTSLIWLAQEKNKKEENHFAIEYKLCWLKKINLTIIKKIKKIINTKSRLICNPNIYLLGSTFSMKLIALHDLMKINFKYIFFGEGGTTPTYYTYT